jgi:peptidoglycan/LPS O-acetylase OafA/YrhL
MRDLFSIAIPSFQKLNLLRFLAASMVAIFHCGYLFSSTHPTLHEFFILGSDGVFIFFIVSGLIIPWSMEQSNYKIFHFIPFLSKRFRRLFPPFIASLMIYWLGWHLEFKPPFITSLVQFLSNLLFIIPFGKGTWVNQIYWTLFIELQFYIVTGLLFHWLQHKNHWIPFSILVILNLLSFITFLLPSWTEKNFIFFHLPYFSLGYLLFMIFRKKTFTLIHLMLFLFILLVLLINIGFLHHIPLSSILFSIITFIYILFFNTTSKFLEKLGDYSYSYYLLHGLMIAWFHHFFQVPETFMGKWLHLIGVISLSWPLAYLGYVVIEKKSLLWSKKIKYTYATDITRSR